jgi:hypothetical protein
LLSALGFQRHYLQELDKAGDGEDLSVVLLRVFSWLWVGRPVPPGEGEDLSVVLRWLIEARNSITFEDDAFTWDVPARKRQKMIADHLYWQAEVIRDLFAPPHVTSRFRREWRTANVLCLAQAMFDAQPVTYEEGKRRFDALPILGDALEEAGCDAAVLLDHCRRQKQHHPGCWLLDLVLRVT